MFLIISRCTAPHLSRCTLIHTHQSHAFTLPGQAIIAAAVAVCQTAWYLAVAEAEIARAMDAVALKTRSAAVADTSVIICLLANTVTLLSRSHSDLFWSTPCSPRYANQGMRSGAILPFTSALAALCGASTAAAVEFLPLLPAVQVRAGPTSLSVAVDRGSSVCVCCHGSFSSRRWPRVSFLPGRPFLQLLLP